MSATKTAVTAALSVFMVFVVTVSVIGLIQNTGSAVPAANGTRIILTLEEIAKHNIAGDCWMIVGQDVYNATGYGASHPGGAEKIADYCGKDATVAFNTKGKTDGSTHSAAADEIHGAMLLGRVGTESVAQTNPSVPVPERDDELED